MPFPTYTDNYVIWSDIGDAVAPSDTKIQQGWARERPPFEYQNWWQKRADELLFEFNRGKSRSVAGYPGSGSLTDDEWNEDVSNEFSRIVLGSTTSRAVQPHGVVVASRNVHNNSTPDYSLAMGYNSAGGPSNANITILFESQTGDGYFAGDVNIDGAVNALDGTFDGFSVSGGSVNYDGSNFSLLSEVNFESGSVVNVSTSSFNLDQGANIDGPLSFTTNGLIDTDVEVAGDVFADSFFAGVNEVYHPGNVSLIVENFMDAVDLADAQSILEIPSDFSGYAQFYDGSSQNRTDYPIGSIVFVVNEAGSPPTRNSTVTIYLNDNGTEFSNSLANSSGTSLSGTWKCRGGYGGNNGLDMFLSQKIAD